MSGKVAQALRQAGVRGIVQTGWAGLEVDGEDVPPLDEVSDEPDRITAVFSAISATAAVIISAIAAAMWSRVALCNGVFNRSPPRRVGGSRSVCPARSGGDE